MVVYTTTDTATHSTLLVSEVTHNTSVNFGYVAGHSQQVLGYKWHDGGADLVEVGDVTPTTIITVLDNVA